MPPEPIHFKSLLDISTDGEAVNRPLSEKHGAWRASDKIFDEHRKAFYLPALSLQNVLFPYCFVWVHLCGRSI